MRRTIFLAALVSVIAPDVRANDDCGTSICVKLVTGREDVFQPTAMVANLDAATTSRV